ncbi:MAG: hypothetical protein ABFE13_11480 [Phycisphaerales bacterium]
MTRYRLDYPPSAGVTSGPTAYWGQRKNGTKYLTPYALAYRASVGRVVRKIMADHNPSGQLSMRVSVHPPDNLTRDWDNIRKVLMDALVSLNVKVNKVWLDVPVLLDDSNKYIRREWVEWLEVVPGGSVELELRDIPRGKGE